MIGELAALGSALLFTVASTSSTLAGRRTSSAIVNRSRLVIALLCMMGAHWLWVGEPLPLGAPAEGWSWLALSGVLGLALGDAALFQAYVLIGPRLSMLVMAGAPAIAAIAAWVFLSETLSLREIAGIGVTLGGIACVVSERKRSEIEAPSRSFGAGLGFALLGTTGQAAGLVTAKLGLGYGVLPLSGNLIRILAATAALWLVAGLGGHVRSTFRALRHDPRASALMLLGALAGPVTGVWLSLVGIAFAPVGVAATLMSLTPIFLVPVSRVLFLQPITVRSVLGTAVTCLGVALLLG